MTTKRALLVSIIILAGVSLVGAQSPTPSPSASPEASASPAKKVRKKKAEVVRKQKRRRHQAQARPHQPRRRNVTLARKQARLPQRRRQPRRLRPIPSRRLVPYLSPNPALVRRQRLPLVLPRLTLRQRRAAVMDWYGLIPTAIFITRKVHAFTAKPSRVNT